MSNPVPIFGTQNLQDDDAQVVDSYLIETDAPPDMASAREPIDKTPDTPIAVTTKFLSSEQVLTPSMTPVMLFPADKNRKNLYVRIVSPTSQAGDAIRIGQTAAEAVNGARVVQGDTPLITDHTGALYAYPQSITGAANSANINVEYWAVTV